MSRSTTWCAAVFLFLTSQICSRSTEAQAPKYAATATVDLNGDGRLDEVRIAEQGSIEVIIAGAPSDGAWTPLAASGRVIEGRIEVSTSMAPGRAIILATSKLPRRGGRSFSEAVALAWTPGKLTSLWRGKVGVVGPDGGSSLSVSLGHYGLIKYYSSLGVSRCDNATAYLDAQRYDFSAGRFRSAHQPMRMEEAQGTPTLIASKRPPRSLPATLQASWFRATAASSSVSASAASQLVAPLALTDGDPRTAWVENKGGAGRGEFATLRSDMGTVHVRAIRLRLSRPSAATRLSRPRRVGVILRHRKFWIKIPRDALASAWIEFPTPITSDCVSVVLDQVYPGSSPEQTAIFEITVFSDEEMDPTQAATRIGERIAGATTRANTSRIIASLPTRAEDALMNALRERLARDKPPMREVRNLRAALASLPASPGQLIAGLSDDGASPLDYRSLGKGLAHLQETVEPLQRALADTRLSNPSYSRLIQALIGIPGAKAGSAMINLLAASEEVSGRVLGGAAKKDTLLHALAGRDDVWSVLATAIGEPRLKSSMREDLYRATRLAGERRSDAPPATGASEDRAKIQRMLARELAGPQRSYPEDYRLLQAAAVMGGPSAQARKVIAGLLFQVTRLQEREDSEGLALLRQALRSLAAAAQHSSSAPQLRASHRVLRAALSHADPGVRLAALSTVADDSLREAVTKRLRADAWSEVRAAAASHLAASCDSISTASLRLAALTDESSKVSRTAFSGLLRCEIPDLFSLATQIVETRTRPFALRIQAARDLGHLATSGEDRRALVRLFTKTREMALSSRASGKIASALARALASIGGSQAIHALQSSAADPAFPQLQVAAITALGTLCSPSSLGLLRRLKTSNAHSVSRAATSAGLACQSFQSKRLPLSN